MNRDSTLIVIDPAGTDAGPLYLRHVSSLLAKVAEEQCGQMSLAAAAIAATIAADGTLHVFGTGHSHMIAEELFYRAGGLLSVRPVLVDALMLHADAAMSTDLERLPGLGSVLIRQAGVTPNDCVIVVSNSGGNSVVCEFAAGARDTGAVVIAITSLDHATSVASREAAGQRLHELADVVLDNAGAPADAGFLIDGFDVPIGPKSTVVAAGLANAIVVEAIQKVVCMGHEPHVYRSANSAGGDAHNANVSAMSGSTTGARPASSPRTR